MRDHLLPFSTFFSFLHSSNIIFENFSFWRESDAEREPLERVRLLAIYLDVRIPAVPAVLITK